MKIILLSTIRLYWLLIPISKRRKCIFKESCSRKVYEQTGLNGFISGLKTLSFRMKNCNSDFDVFTDSVTGNKKMILKTGVIVNESQIAERLK